MTTFQSWFQLQSFGLFIAGIPFVAPVGCNADEPGDGTSGAAGQAGSASQAGAAGSLADAGRGAAGGVGGSHAGTGGQAGNSETGGAPGTAGAAGAAGAAGEQNGSAGQSGSAGSTANITLDFDFKNGSQGFLADYADYKKDDENIEFESGIKALPTELGAGSGYFLKSSNRSDDVFMFLKKKLTAADGLVAGASYELTYNVVFGSNAQSNCFGIGGAPGEAVTFKVGASGIEPLPVLAPDDYLRMNIDKGNQKEGGLDAAAVSNIANGEECDGNAHYVSLTPSHIFPKTKPYPKADDKAELWLVLGTDSGFEGVTALYFQSVKVTLKRIP